MEEFKEKLENILRYGSPYGKKRTITVSSIVYCPMKGILNTYFRTRNFGERRQDAIIGDVLHRGLMRLIEEYWEYIKGDVDGKPQTEKQVEYEIEVNGEKWIITGRVDLIINNHIVEFKFLREKKYDKIPNDLETISEDDSINAYRDQTLMYIHMSNATDGELWLFKNNQLVPWKKFKIERNEKRFQELLEIAKLIISGVQELENGRIPEVNAPRFKWECNYCVYYPICPKRLK